MTKVTSLIVLLSAAWSLAPGAPGKPSRINKAIDLLEQKQPVYYASGQGGFAEGVKAAQTWADYINYEMEHGVFDLAALREFMRGLVKGGPTRSGHRTPAVIVTLPVLGLDEAGMRANSWVVQQVLACGVHGILLCHARSPEAIRILVQASRYPFQKKGVGAGGLDEGFRGAGSQGFASEIWGIPANEYLRRADVWPLNPEGELLLGLKIEDRHALANAERSTRVPGIGFAEWGPSDMSFSLLDLPTIAGPEPRTHPEMLRARGRVLAACKAAKIYFLNTVAEDDVEKMIQEGVMIGSGGQAAAERGRRFTRRTMPW
jgi:4-hydroxy-2-oxoheptanedioate aldolase